MSRDASIGLSALADSLSRYDELERQMKSRNATSTTLGEKREALSQDLHALDDLYYERVENSNEPVLLEKDISLFNAYALEFKEYCNSELQTGGTILDVSTLIEAVRGAISGKYQGDAKKFLEHEGRSALRHNSFAPSIDTLTHINSIHARSHNTTRRITRETGPAEEAENINIENLETNDERLIIASIYNEILADFKETGGSPLPYYQLVLNNQSFAQTVENMFYVSFLIRDGKLRLHLEDGSDPVVYPDVEPMRGDEKDYSATERRHLIAELTHGDWKLLCRAYEPVLPSRRDHDSYAMPVTEDGP